MDNGHRTRRLVSTSPLACIAVVGVLQGYRASELHGSIGDDNVAATAPPALMACGGAVDSVRYSFPLHHSWEAWDQSYMDSPNGLTEYANGGVMYDYHRDTAGNEAPPDGIPPQPGFRDYMGGNTTYDKHNGYDSSLAPARVHVEGSSEVYPIAAGIVTEVVVNSAQTSEDIVAVEHANGYRSRYVHLQNGSVRVRPKDPVTTSTVLATLGVAESHLHFDLHDCDFISANGPGEPSYYEIFRADRRLFGRAPFYESGPSDVFEVQISRMNPPTPGESDDLRYNLNDAIQIAAWGQWRTGDAVDIWLVDPSGNVQFLYGGTNNSQDRWGRFTHSTAWPLSGALSATGDWYVRVRVNGIERSRKYFRVAAGPPDATGPVQSIPSVVSWGTNDQAVFYRGPDGRLKVRRWNLESGWSNEADQGGPFQGRPSCIARSSTQIDCFLLGMNNHLWRWASTNFGQSGTFSDIYGASSVLADPAALSWSKGSMEVIVRHANNTLGRLSWNGTGFVYFAAGAYPPAAPPSCAALSATVWRCYARASNGALHEIQFASGVPISAGPAGPTVITVAIQDDVTVALLPGEGTLANRIDVSSRDAANQMIRQIRLGYTDSTAGWMPPQYVGAGILTVVPSCNVRTGTNVFECFAADEDHRLVINSWTGTRWSGWNPVALAPMDRVMSPSVVSVGPRRLDLLYTKTLPLFPNATVQETSTDNVWDDNDNFGAGNVYGPGCVVRNANTVDCYTVNAAHAVVRRTRTTGTWGSPATVPLSLAHSQISALARSATNIQIFYRSPGGSVRSQTWNGTNWLTAEGEVGSAPAGPIVGAPSCLIRPWATTTTDCFVRDPANNLMQRTLTSSGGWGAWAAVPGVQAFSSPSAVATGTTSLSVFYRGRDNSLRTVALGTGGWAAEEHLAGSISSAPACVARINPSRIDCFAQGFANLPDDHLHYAYQASIGWLPPRAVGQGLANLALNQTATQSSTYSPNPAPASRAVDGNLDGRFSQGSVSHTSNDPLTNGTFASWQIDLGNTRPVDHVQVFNRTDLCCTTRLNGFLVEVRATSQTPWIPVPTTFTQSSGGNGGMLTVNRTDPAFPGVAIPIKSAVRYVRIRLNHRDYLHLAEVMVMGRERN